MGLSEGGAQIGPEVGEVDGEGVAAADEDVVDAVPTERLGIEADRLAQAAADAVANDGVADLLGHGETAARRGLGRRGDGGLEREAGAVGPHATGDGEELGALLQSVHVGGDLRRFGSAGRCPGRITARSTAPTGSLPSIDAPSGTNGVDVRRLEARRSDETEPPGSVTPAGSRSDRSGRQALATASAATGEHQTAADGGGTGAETVAALAHDLGGLVGALHGSSPPRRAASSSRVVPDPPKPADEVRGSLANALSARRSTAERITDGERQTERARRRAA
jgi:hypothetical protein